MDLKAHAQEGSRLVFSYCLHFHLRFVTEELTLIKFQTGVWQVLVRCWSVPLFDTNSENLEENIFIYLWFILNDALNT
jgi:hypothetical protein